MPHFPPFRCCLDFSWTKGRIWSNRPAGSSRGRPGTPRQKTFHRRMLMATRSTTKITVKRHLSLLVTCPKSSSSESCFRTGSTRTLLNWTVIGSSPKGITRRFLQDILRRFSIVHQNHNANTSGISGTTRTLQFPKITSTFSPED